MLFLSLRCLFSELCSPSLHNNPNFSLSSHLSLAHSGGCFMAWASTWVKWWCGLCNLAAWRWVVARLCVARWVMVIWVVARWVTDSRRGFWRGGSWTHSKCELCGFLAVEIGELCGFLAVEIGELYGFLTVVGLWLMWAWVRWCSSGKGMGLWWRGLGFDFRFWILLWILISRGVWCDWEIRW